tara:strand:- start:174 stop:518 length:345 start_codon:yes stop_codon:yes gene_type:complete
MAQVLESDEELRKGQHVGHHPAVLVEVTTTTITAETREDVGTTMTKTTMMTIRIITIAETMATMTITTIMIVKMIDRIVIEVEAEVHRQGATAEDSKEGVEALAPAARRGKDPA